MSDTPENSSSPDWTQIGSYTGTNGYPVYLWECRDRPEPLFKATIYLHAPWSWIGYRTPEEALKRVGIIVPAKTPAAAAQPVAAREAPAEPKPAPPTMAAPVPLTEVVDEPVAVEDSTSEPVPLAADEAGQVALF